MKHTARGGTADLCYKAPRMLDKISREDFEPLIGQKFVLTAAEGETFDFSLVDVVELPPPRSLGRGRQPVPETVRRAPFSLFFRGQPLLPQATYAIQNDALGAEPISIFIVPV